MVICAALVMCFLCVRVLLLTAASIFLYWSKTSLGKKKDENASLARVIRFKTSGSGEAGRKGDIYN